jgi:nucleoside-diphosphate-sugar epimerase
MNSAHATRNLLDALFEVGRTKRFVSVSSFAVYSNFAMKRGAVLDESSPLEDAPMNRHDAYAFGKLKQEEIVRDPACNHGIPYVILRPGAVFGPGRRDLTSRIGVWARGVFLHVGGANQLPLTYVDNCADAIVQAGLHPGIDGETFNVVDDDLPTSRQFLRAYRRRVRHLVSIPLPYSAVYCLSAICEFASRKIERLPRTFNRRRCAAEWKGNRFPNNALHDRVGWKPHVDMSEAMERFFAQF